MFAGVVPVVYIFCGDRPPCGDAGAVKAVSLYGPKSAGMVESAFPPGDEGGGALIATGVPQRGQLLMPGWSAVPHEIQCMTYSPLS